MILTVKVLTSLISTYIYKMGTEIEEFRKKTGQYVTLKFFIDSYKTE